MTSRMLTAAMIVLSAACIPKATMAEATHSLNDYDFVAPEGWQIVRKPEQIILTQLPDQTGCLIQILPPQPSSGDLQQDAVAVLELMYQGWNYQRSGEARFTLTKGWLARGLEYCLLEAPMNTTSGDGRYHLEEGAALVVRMGQQVAIVAVRHRGLLGHVDCQRRYETWRRFFNSFTVKGIAHDPKSDDEARRRIVGVWSQTESGASSEFVFAANGHYARSGALGAIATSQDLNFEYLRIKTYAFEGDGTYAVSGDVLTLKGRADKESDQKHFRFEQINHGGAGWKDRLWLLSTNKLGKYEVGYERKSTP